MDQAERAQDLADRFWEQLLELEPLIGTMVGDERYDDRLPDPSDEGVSRSADVARDALAELGTIDRDALDVGLRGTLDLLEAIARRNLAGAEQRFDRLQGVSHIWGPAQLLVDLGTTQRVDTPERVERYLARLRGVPAYLEAVGGVAAEGARLGVVAPRIVVERAIHQVERLIEIPAEDSPGLASFSGDDADRGRLVDTIRDDVMPAYESYLAALGSYLPAAPETIGLSFLPDGDAMYAAQILAWTTLPLAAGDVHELGLTRLEMIQRERAEIAGELGFATAEEAIASHTEAGRNTASSREAMVALAEEQVARGWDAAPRYFGRLPSDSCEVRAVEEFREADMPMAFYQPPSEDGSRRGLYYVNTSDLPSRPLHHLAAVSYHEANPGHHFQFSLTQEMRDRPRLLRFGGILAGSAYIEGWGLYCERLAEEMGLYLDGYERLGMLEGQALRAARLVVDTGIHALGWGRERGIEVLMSAGAPRVDAEIETDRYVTMPGQALSYMIGQLEIERLRVEAERRPDFALPAFHDRVLSLGELPLTSLRREMTSDASTSS